MPKRSLFIGCSHTMGYKFINNKANIWSDNNYAEIYSEINNKPIIVMASGGCGNRAFVNFLASALKEYDDIDEVFIQSTYWGRFPFAINPDLDEQKIFPLEWFLQKDFESDKIDRWSIGLNNGPYFEQYLKTESEDYEKFKYQRDTTCTYQPDIRKYPYIYIQTWHYNQTHLAQQDYIKDITLMDTLCANRNIPLYLWNMNSDMYIPSMEIMNGFYSNLKVTSLAPKDAISYITQNFDTKIETVDDEHYVRDVHEVIAKEYIPYIKEM